MRLAHTKLYEDIKSKGFTKEQMRSIRKQLIRAIENGRWSNVKGPLIQAFHWSSSPQGEDYWVEIYSGNFVEAN